MGFLLKTGFLSLSRPAIKKLDHFPLVYFPIYGFALSPAFTLTFAIALWFPSHPPIHHPSSINPSIHHTSLHLLGTFRVLFKT